MDLIDTSPARVAQLREFIAKEREAMQLHEDLDLVEQGSAVISVGTGLSSTDIRAQQEVFTRRKNVLRTVQHKAQEASTATQTVTTEQATALLRQEATEVHARAQQAKHELAAVYEVMAEDPRTRVVPGTRLRFHQGEEKPRIWTVDEIEGDQCVCIAFDGKYPTRMVVELSTVQAYCTHVAQHFRSMATQSA